MPNVKEHQLLMKGPLVRATLEGRKTQTRRPVKTESLPDPGFVWAECLCREIDPSDTPCPTCLARFPGIPEAGDRLWVRETWAWPGEEEFIYRADQWAEDMVAKWKTDPNYPQVKWSPSIHMPRRACRLVLPLVSVRVERVQDISEADAWAEGYEEHWQRRVKEAGADGPLGRPDARGWFAMLWDKLYGTWGKNPWVVVYEWGQIEVNR